MLVTKDLDNKFFEYIDPWIEILAYIAWARRAYYHCIVEAKPRQAVFSRDIIFNFVSFVEWKVITAKKSDKWTLIIPKKMLGGSRMTTQLVIWYMCK